MKSSYPKSILPLAKYNKTLDIDGLLQVFPNLAVVRQITEEEGDITKASTDVVGLSMNLLGGRYEVSRHLPFLPKSEDAIKQWDGGDVDLNDYTVDCYSFTDPCFGAYFKVADIHNLMFPFRRTFNSQNEREDYETKINTQLKNMGLTLEERLVEAFVSKKDPVNIYSITKISHAPVQLNYWHITLEVLPLGSNEYVPTIDRKKSSVKSTAKLIKMHLDTVVSYILPQSYRLKREHYIDNLSFWDKLCDFIGI